MTNTEEEGSQVAMELFLGLNPQGATLHVAPGARPLDLQPWLLDCVAARVGCLGHHDEFPRAWDWENLLTLLEPGEELMYVLDHSLTSADQNKPPFTLWIALRFPRTPALSARDLDRRRKRARLLLSQFQRQAFPGSDVVVVAPEELARILDFSTSPQRCVSVSGLPSPRTLEDEQREMDRSNAGRNYQSLNDVVESLIDLHCPYRIAFVVGRVGTDALQEQLGLATQLRDAIHPWIRRTVQQGTSQGTNTGRSVTDASGTNTSTSKTEGIQFGGNIGVVILGMQAAYNYARSNTKGTTWTRTEGSSSSISQEESRSESQERLQSKLELADRSLERTVAALHEAHGTGGYRWSAFVLADEDNADLISHALVGVLAGSRTKDRPFTCIPVTGMGAEIFQGTEALLDLIAEATPILPLPRACEALLLPEAELPGVRLRQNVFLGRNHSPPEDKDERKPRVRLGPDAFSSLTGDTSSQVEIPGRDLFRHLLVAGTTGSGKTTRVVEILNGLQDNHLSVVVFETAKCVYRTKLRRPGRPAPWVYSLGSSREHPGERFRPLRLNPFFFELGTSLKRHIETLSDALAELMPTEAMIAPLMRRAIENSYQERGWDIERGLPVEGVPSWPSVLDFAVHVRQIAKTLNYGPEVMANYRGALENRAALFMDATFQDLFGHDGNTSIDELFPANQDAIIEVEELPPSEVDIRAFVMTLLLSRLRAVQTLRKAGTAAHRRDERSWLIVIEEAHNVLDRAFETRRPSGESNAGRTLLRCLDRLLQEGREMEMGVMVIDQSPTQLARSVLSNTGTKIVLRLEDGAEMEEIGRALGLEEEAWKKLGFLQEGEAIIKASYMATPVKTARFRETTPGPETQAPSTEGLVPSYAKLDQLWHEVLTGSRFPDDPWRDALLTAAHQNVALATFVGANRLLDQHRNDPAVLARTRGLRAVLTETNPSANQLLDAARTTFKQTVILMHYHPLLGMARIMFRALVQPAAADPKVNVVGVGVQRTAELLAAAGIGQADSWKIRFLALASATGPRWKEACARFAMYCTEVGRSDATVPLRVHLLAIETYSHRLSSRAIDPVELVLQARALVQQASEPSPPPEDSLASQRWQVLVDHCIHWLAIDLASQQGEAMKRAVEALMTTENPHP